MITRLIAGTVSTFITLCLIATTSVAIAADKTSADIGKKEFLNNCAVCHGVTGKGDGSFVELLKQAPSDLTLISKRNGGVYPLIKVYNLISGVDRIASHGTLEMPIWGERYNQETVQEVGPMNTGPSPSVRERILELVFYIGTLQQNP
jgi:mono/diheme cytochrome c family protein